MTEIKDEILLSYTDILPDLAQLFPQASQYMLETLSYTGTFDTVDSLKPLVEELKNKLEITSQPLDDLLISVILGAQSADAAVFKVKLYKSKKAVEEISSSLALDSKYKNLLLKHYANPCGGKFFIDEYNKRSSSFDDDFKKGSSEFSKIIDTLISKAEKEEKTLHDESQENARYLGALYKDKKIPYSLFNSLSEVYAAPSCLRAFKPAFESLLTDLGKINDNPSQNVFLACKVLLNIITGEEASSMADLAKALKYPLLHDDLQKIAFKYLKHKSAQEIAETFDAVLKRLPHIDDPVENLGLAVRVLCEAKEETMKNAEIVASEKKGKVLFMRKLAADKLFSGYEDQLTHRFYGRNNIEEITSMFNHILQELPANGDIYENSDIAMKVLVKKLPLKDAVAQASFRKENKSGSTVYILENEAFGSYLGIKSKEEVFSFFRDKLSTYDFWKQDEDKHCYALSVMVDELNGNTSAFLSDLAMHMLEKGYHEEAIEIITKGLASQDTLDRDTIISAYDKFFTGSNDLKDAARRVVNMFQ